MQPRARQPGALECRRRAAFRDARWRPHRVRIGTDVLDHADMMLPDRPTRAIGRRIVSCSPFCERNRRRQHRGVPGVHGGDLIDAAAASAARTGRANRSPTCTTAASVAGSTSMTVPRTGSPVASSYSMPRTTTCAVRRRRKKDGRDKRNWRSQPRGGSIGCPWCTSRTMVTGPLTELRLAILRAFLVRPRRAFAPRTPTPPHTPPGGRRIDQSRATTRGRSVFFVAKCDRLCRSPR